MFRRAARRAINVASRIAGHIRPALFRNRDSVTASDLLLRATVRKQIGKVAPDHAERPSWRLAITYANDQGNEGAGAHLQRIYGVYAISRQFDIPYVHSPLGHVAYQGLMALESGSPCPDPSFADAFNAELAIPSDVALPEQYYALDLPKVDLAAIEALKRRAGADPVDHPLLVRIVLPYGITDRLPDSYAACRAVSPFAASKKEGPLRVAVHVRRGEILIGATKRLLPNHYYISAAGKIAGILERLGIAYQIDLHTEVSTHEIIVPPEALGLGKPLTINAEMCRIEDFDVLPKLVKRINEPAIDCLSAIAAADIILMSRSSFSYVAAILSSDRTIVIYHPFWHAPMSGWLCAAGDGAFDESAFVRKIHNLLADRPYWQQDGITALQRAK